MLLSMSETNWMNTFSCIGLEFSKEEARSSWQDGVLGANCPIPSKWNWTYEFQVKDQIGNFFYFPSLNMQRASGGFGSFIINNRAIIPIPFDTPNDDIELLIGDWYTRNHTALRKALDAGKDLAMSDGVLINGKGPHQYNTTLVPDGIDYETIEVHPSLSRSLDSYTGITRQCWGMEPQSRKPDSWYLGQETYIRVVNPEENNKTEFPVPDNPLFCGSLGKLQKAQDITSAAPMATSRPNPVFVLMAFVSALMSITG